MQYYTTTKREPSSKGYYTLTGKKYLNSNNLYSYIEASRGIRTSVNASTWMLAQNDK